MAAYRCDDCGERFTANDTMLIARWSTASGMLVLLLAIALVGSIGNPDTVALPRNYQTDIPDPLGAPAREARVQYPVVYNLEELLSKAEAGAPEDQYELALALLREYEINGELAIRGESVRWMREAATGGYPRAQAEMGNLYINGRGVVQDFTQAAVWYRKAAEQGDAEAMYGLGKMAQAGWGMDESMVDAYVWLNLASARGETRADEVRSHVLKVLSADQLNEAQERSRDLDETIP